MGNNQNSKLDRKYSSLPPANFPSPKQESSFIRKITRSSKRKQQQQQPQQQPQHQQQPQEQQSAQAEPGQEGEVPQPRSPKKTQQEWTVPFTDALFLPEYPLKEDIGHPSFQVTEVIAKGAFGNVLRVRRLKDKSEFALKVMKKAQVIVDGAVQQCKDEATIQNFVGHHPFIVKPYYFYQDREHVFIVMEYIPRGELFAAWRQLDSFSENLVRIYIAELAMVLEFLHHSGVIYRDLKMENILIDGEGHLQVIDFGLAKWLKWGERTRTICGTLQYIAPEVLSVQPYGHAADWWSLGILMYALLTGEYPVTGAKNHYDMAEMVQGHIYDLPLYHNYTWPARETVRKLLQVDPEHRIQDLASLQRLTFFQDVNFEGLLQRQISPNLYLESEETFGFGFREQELLRRRRSVARSIDGELDAQPRQSLLRSKSLDLLMDRPDGLYDYQQMALDVDWDYSVELPHQREATREYQPRASLLRSASVDMDLGAPSHLKRGSRLYQTVLLHDRQIPASRPRSPGDGELAPAPKRDPLYRSASVDFDPASLRSPPEVGAAVASQFLLTDLKQGHFYTSNQIPEPQTPTEANHAVQATNIVSAPDGESVPYFAYQAVDPSNTLNPPALLSPTLSPPSSPGQLLQKQNMETLLSYPEELESLTLNDQEFFEGYFKRRSVAYRSLDLDVCHRFMTRLQRPEPAPPPATDFEPLLAAHDSSTNDFVDAKPQSSQTFQSDARTIPRSLSVGGDLDESEFFVRHSTAYRTLHAGWRWEYSEPPVHDGSDLGSNHDASSCQSPAPLVQEYSINDTIRWNESIASLNASFV